jgi:energy-coupling factor transport system ATP-binding protein
LLTLAALAACRTEGEAPRLSAPAVTWRRDALVVPLPAGHPWRELRLLDSAQAALLVQPLAPGAAFPSPLEVPWEPGERYTLELHGESATAFLRIALLAPARAAPEVSVQAQLPAGVALPGAAAALLVPADTTINLGLLFKLESGAPRVLHLHVSAEGAVSFDGSTAEHGISTEQRVELAAPGAVALVEIPLRASSRSGAGRMRWSVSEEPELSGSVALEVRPAEALLGALEPLAPVLPVDVNGQSDPGRPRSRIVLDPPWIARLGRALGWIAPRDPALPVALVRSEIANRDAAPILLRARSFVTAENGIAPLAVFADPALDGSLTALGLVRPEPGQTAMLVHPLFLAPDVPPGAYRYCTEWSPWDAASAAGAGGAAGAMDAAGEEGSARTACSPFSIGHSPLPGWVAVWSASALSLLALAWALRTLPRWLPAFGARELVLIALTAGLAFVVVSIPYALVHAVLLLLAGPFLFLLDGVLFKLLLFLLLGVLFALAPRPGVYLLFYLVWALFQAVLNGHYTPQVLLFAGAAAVTVEAGLWLAGLTRGGGERALRHWHRRLLAALLLGAAEATVIFWHMQLIQVLYRQYLAGWYVALHALSGGAYAALGAALGLSLGLRLRAMQRPPLPAFAEPAAPGAPFAVPPPVPNPGAGAPLLELNGLSFRYPGAAQAALRAVSFRVEPGELVLLTGPSGCGKTTLLRAIQGLLPVADPAAIRLAGRPAREFPPASWARRCGLLFQEPALQMLRRTARQDVAFTHDLTRMASAAPPDSSHSDASHGVEASLAEFGLAALADRDLRGLSGGELQRAALAGLWAGSPRLLLLDEPLANLDAHERPRLMQRLRELSAQGLAVIVAEHRLEPVARVATRVIRLGQGVVEWDGPSAALRYLAPLSTQDPLPVLRAGAKSGRNHSASSSEPPLVRLHEVSFRHAGLREPLLAALDAEIPRGQAIVLSGDNGAGKSTVLELIAGRLRPESGRIVWREGLVNGARPALGYLPQQADRILQAPTATEEIAFALRIRRVPKAVREARAAGWLARLGLGQAAGRFPHLLSRGERQRLALGAVMIAEPELLLLDEPFAGQDAAQVAAILALCRGFLDENPGRALLVATHDLDLVDGFFDAHWRLERGALLVEREQLVTPWRNASGGAG